MEKIELFEVHLTSGDKVVIDGQRDWEYDNFFSCDTWYYITSSCYTTDNYGWRKGSSCYINPKYISLVIKKIDPKFYPEW